MKSLFLLFIFFILNSNDTVKIREHYKQINHSQEAVVLLKETTDKCNSISVSLKKAYLAAAEMASAKYMFSPIKKIEAFNSGKVKLEEAILMESTSLELRYIRISIQKNIPSILNYHKNINEDKLFILKNLKGIKSQDIELYKDVFAFMLYSFVLTPDEKSQILG
jgi:hypothetical protein